MIRKTTLSFLVTFFKMLERSGVVFISNPKKECCIQIIQSKINIVVNRGYPNRKPICLFNLLRFSAKITGFPLLIFLINLTKKNFLMPKWGKNSIFHDRIMYFIPLN
jgi:hypothetical protein